jgi:hypothetical protein
VNLVIPEEEAAIRLPLLVLFTINAALFPIPPDTDNGAGVVAFPTNTLLLKSDDNVRFPEPAAVNVRLLAPAPDVVIVPAPPFPIVAVVPLTVRLLAMVNAPALVSVLLPVKN